VEIAFAQFFSCGTTQISIRTLENIPAYLPKIPSPIRKPAAYKPPNRITTQKPKIMDDSPKTKPTNSPSKETRSQLTTPENPLPSSNLRLLPPQYLLADTLLRPEGREAHPVPCPHAAEFLLPAEGLGESVPALAH